MTESSKDLHGKDIPWRPMNPCRFHPENPAGACPECSTDGCAPTIYLANEHRRMLIAFNAIYKISGDMLDPVRRAGPGLYEKNKIIRNANRELCSLQEDESTIPDVKEGLE